MAEMLSAFLAETGLSQQQLSTELAAVGYSVKQPNICRWLKGDYVVTPKTLEFMEQRLRRVRLSLAQRWDAYHAATNMTDRIRAAVALLPGDTWFEKYLEGSSRTRGMLRRSLHEAFPELASVSHEDILAAAREGAAPPEGKP